MMSKDEEQDAKRANLARCKAQGEKTYDEMYEAHSFEHARACYGESKDCFGEAMKLAEELGLIDEANSIMKRLDHIKAVFRSQFVQ
jgi:hypothetical protein